MNSPKELLWGLWVVQRWSKLEGGRHLGRASRSVTTVTVATDGKVKESRHTVREKARIEGYIGVCRLGVYIQGSGTGWLTKKRPTFIHLS